MFVAFMAIAASLQAAVTPLKSGDTLPGTVWKVEFDAPVTLAFDDGNTSNVRASFVASGTWAGARW